jgi:hypothetical protein
VSDIFISYSDQDKAKAAAMAKALEAAGKSVWWDNDLLPGIRFTAALADKIDHSQAVVVMWSESSIKSDYVCDEADRARISGRLTPVLIDNVRPPVGFGQIHTYNLVGWNGAPDDPALQDFIARLGARNGEVEMPAPSPMSQPQRKATRAWPFAAALAAVAIAGGAYLAGQYGALAPAQAADNTAECKQLAGPAVDWDTLTGHAGAAIEACEAAIAAAPTPRLHYMLGRAYDTGGDFDGAVRNYTIGANGGDISALDSLGETLAYDKLPEAKLWCQKALDAGVTSARKRLDSLN